MIWPFRRVPQAPPAPRVAPSFEREPRAGITIGYDARASAATRPAAKPHVPWTPAKPMPGVVPSNMPLMATDNDLSSLYGGMPTEGALWDEGGIGRWMGYWRLSELAQRPEFRRMSEIIAKEMTRKWIRLRSTSDDDKRSKIKVLDTAMKRYRVRQHFRRLTELDGFFGSARLYIDTGAGNDRDELMTPLTRTKEKIGLGGLKRLRVVEPMWCYPAEYNTSDPLSQNYYRPSAWWVMGRRIHASRLLPFVSREVPDILKPVYSFGGLSLTQIALPYVENWIRTRQSVSDLIHSFSTTVLKTNLLATLADTGGGRDDIGARIDIFNAYRDNRNAAVIDKDSEDLANISTPLGTLDHLQAQSQEQMASIAGIPLVVLLAITPSGLNASSDGEIRAFYSWIAAQQEQFYDDNLAAVIEIIQLSTFGEIDPDITFSYEPLWELDDAARASIRKTDADTAVAYLNAGVLSPREERERLASDEAGVYTGLDVDDMPEDPGMGEDPLADPNALPGQPQPGQPASQPPSPPTTPRPPAPAPPPRGDGHVVVPLRRAVGDSIARDADWKEGDHPRGQPGNAGEFGPGGGGGGSKPPAAKPAAAPAGQTDQPAGQTKSNPEGGGKSSFSATIGTGKARTLADGSPLPPHIAKLAIPPGWSDVQVNRDPAGALLAEGKDSKGRRTSIYSNEHGAKQGEVKFARVAQMAKDINTIAAKNDVARADPKTADVADCFDLVMKMGIRPGSESDTGAAYKSYGATTLEGRHVVQDADGNVSLTFVPGKKKGQTITLPVSDPDLAKRLVERAHAAGPDGQIFGKTNEGRLLAHMKTIAGDKFKTKDLRTNVGTSYAYSVVQSMPTPTDAKSYKAQVLQVARAVSAKLGNTPAVALQSYIAPEVFSRWQISSGVTP